MKYINYDIIDQNIKKILETNEICLVLKNNAYNFDIDKIFRLGLTNSIYTYAVNSIFEAIYLRGLSDVIDIILFGNSLEYLSDLIKYRIIPTVNNIDDINVYKSNNIDYSMEFDLCMNRFGIKKLEEDLLKDYHLKYLYVHFPMIIPNIDKHIKNIVDLANKYNVKCHFGGSSLYGYTDSMLRIGKIIYMNSDSFFGKVVNIKYVNKGETVGYDCLYKANDNIKIGILDVGYYNGLKVNFDGYVYCKFKKYKVIGKVCMNNCFILIDDDIKIGDIVEFYGENISKNVFLKYNNMTDYESFLLIK